MKNTKRFYIAKIIAILRKLDDEKCGNLYHFIREYAGNEIK